MNAAPDRFPGPLNRSRTQSSRQRRNVERLEAVMGEPAHVALEQLPQVGHAVFQHRDAVDAHAPGKALIDVEGPPRTRVRSITRNPVIAPGAAGELMEATSKPFVLSMRKAR